MRLFPALLVLGGVKVASAATRPYSTPVCDFYAESIFGSNTAATQLHLIAHLFNQAVVGNFEPTNKSIVVSGFANSQPYKGSYQTLSHYFDSSLNSSNLGGSSGGQKLLLDDGGPVPLLSDKPSNGTASNQYKLFTRAYYLWGELLNCSKQGVAEFPYYNGNQNMWEVHKYMNLGSKEMGLFIDEHVFSALALGFSKDDADAFNYTLTSKYGYRCSPPRPISDAKLNYTSYPQSCCIAADCPIDPNGGNCNVVPYTEALLVPTNVTTDTTPSGTANTSASATSSSAVNTISSGAAAGFTRDYAGSIAGAMIAGAVVVAHL